MLIAFVVETFTLGVANWWLYVIELECECECDLAEHTKSSVLKFRFAEACV